MPRHKKIPGAPVIPPDPAKLPRTPTPRTLAEIELQKQASQHITINGVARYTVRVLGKPTTFGPVRMVELVTRLCEYEETNLMPADIVQLKNLWRTMLYSLTQNARQSKTNENIFVVPITKKMLDELKSELEKPAARADNNP
jgi:hypothetical protein